MKMSRLLAATAWLLLTPSCDPNAPGVPCTPSDGPTQKDVEFVKLVRRDAQSELFKGQLVNVQGGEIILEASGKGTQLQEFQDKSAALAPPDKTITVDMPLANAADVVVRPPAPPGPRGQEKIWIDFATRTANLYGSALEEQKLNPPTP